MVTSYNFRVAFIQLLCDLIFSKIVPCDFCKTLACYGYITLSGKTSALAKSLYKEEGELDGFEYQMAMALTGIENVKWWHRNPDNGRFAFCLNAFRNHYPDFIVMTRSGKILLVETKGDQLENAESREKIRLGRAWQNAAGSQYRYYVVFQNKDLHLDGAYRFDEFLKILKEL